MTPRDGLPRLLARSVRRGDAQASQGVRDPVLSFGQKSRETAVPVASAARRRASKSLADDRHRLRHFSYPADCGDDL